MKKMKKLSAVLLSLVIILATCITAFATTPPDYSITITGAYLGETYKAYKLLDLSVDNPENPGAYRYTVNENWNALTQAGDLNTAFEKVFKVDNDYVTSSVSSESDWQSSTDLSAFAEAAAKYANANSIANVGEITIKEENKITADDGTVSYSAKFNIKEPGYYLITSTMGWRSMITTTPSANEVTINEKNDENSVDKYVKENDATGNNVYFKSNTAQIGETVTFRSEVLVVPRTTNLKLLDKMDSGLTLDKNTIKVYKKVLQADGSTKEELYTDNYTITYAQNTFETDSEGNGSNDTFTINFDDKVAADLSAETTFIVTYDALLNGNTVVNEGNTVSAPSQLNKTYVSFGDKQESAMVSTETKTFSAEIFKYATGNEAESLPGSVFELYKDGVLVNLVKIDEHNYRIADGTEKDADGAAATPVSHAKKAENYSETIANGTLVKDCISVANGSIVLWGLDGESGYKIEEIQSPDGYNKLDAARELNWTTNNAFSITKVENSTGLLLPSTGGIGTTVFYIAGGVLVLGAAVFFVVRRKMNREESA